MKELSIEQKAKAYDEAYKKVAIRFGSNVADEIFLKESEDERIRKGLIGYFRAGKCENVSSYHGISTNDILDWLEKQGEQETDKWNILSAKKGDMLSNGTIVLIVDSIEEFEGRPIINSWYFADSEKFYGKGTSECDRWEVNGFRTATEAECNYLLKMMSDAGYVWNTNKLELMEIEQKPSWSEEDNKMSRFIGNAITADDASIYLKSKGIQIIDAHIWLEELKERVQPQQKQEWKQENTGELTDFENAMMHIGGSFFGENAGLSKSSIKPSTKARVE